MELSVWKILMIISTDSIFFSKKYIWKHLINGELPLSCKWFYFDKSAYSVKRFKSLQPLLVMKHAGLKQMLNIYIIHLFKYLFSVCDSFFAYTLLIETYNILKNDCASKCLCFQDSSGWNQKIFKTPVP